MGCSFLFIRPTRLVSGILTVSLNCRSVGRRTMTRPRPSFLRRYSLNWRCKKKGVAATSHLKTTPFFLPFLKKSGSVGILETRYFFWLALARINSRSIFGRGVLFLAAKTGTPFPFFLLKVEWGAIFGPFRFWHDRPYQFNSLLHGSGGSIFWKLEK